MPKAMPTGVRKRGDKFFVDVSHKGKRKTATCDSLSEALDKRTELLDALQNGKEVAQSRANARVWTLKEALDKTLSLPKPEGWRGTSYEKQATLNAEDAIAFMGSDRKLDAISRELIDAWFHSCETKGNSDSTINRKRSALSKLMRVAVEYGGLAAMPSLPRQRKEPVGRIRQISTGEEAELLTRLEHMGKHEIAAAVIVLIDTGMRCGELWNVRPVDVDLKNKVVMVYGTEGKGTKNGKIRSVPLTKRVSDILRQRMTGRVCFDIDKSEMRRAWDSVRSGMGLMEDKNFTPHVCRHTTASRLVKAGVSLPVVQQWLGHSNIATTMRYAHLYPSDLMNAAAALERMNG